MKFDVTIPETLKNADVSELPGVFVVIEGPDASGKTTICDLVVEKLRVHAPVLKTQEPYSQVVRAWVNEGHSSIANALVMMGDRFDHVAGEVIPALANGKIVVSSRYSASTLVYNVLRTAGLPLLMNHLLGLWRFIPQPDLQYLILAEPTTILQRLRRRAGSQTLVDDSDFPMEFVEYLVHAYTREVPKLEPVHGVFWTDNADGERIAEEISVNVYKHWLGRLNKMTKARPAADSN